MKDCPNSPTGKHCYHTDHSMYSWPPKSPKCCHCGKTERDEHGPFYPGDGTGYPYYPYVGFTCESA